MPANSDLLCLFTELRQEIRESNQERRESEKALDLRLRRLEIALVRHRVRARMLTAACGAGASAATHLLAKYYH